MSNPKGRPQGSKNKLMARARLAEMVLDRAKRTGRTPISVVLDVMAGIGQDGIPIDEGGKPWTPEQISAARDALPYTTPKLIAVKMQVTEPPDPKLEALRHMTLEERRKFRDLLAAAEARRNSRFIEPSGIDADPPDKSIDGA